MSAYCPHCEKEIAAQAQECEYCGANFSNAEGWKPTSVPSVWKPKITGPDAAVIQALGRLIIGGIGWFAFMLLAIFAGFSGGYSAGRTWIGFAQLLLVGVLVWVILPTVRLFARK